MADARDAEKIRREAIIRRGERDVADAVLTALTDLGKYAMAALLEAGMDPSVLDERWPEWQQQVEQVVEPEVARVYDQAYADEYEQNGHGLTAAGYEMSPAASRHLTGVHNRMVGISDAVFDVIRTSLDEGRVAGEDIPTMAKRVESALADAEATTWRNRGVTVARTEVIAANNAGHAQAAASIAGELGEDPGAVVKEWLATHDGRTRPTHSEADGQQVVGLSTPFDVGGALLAQPGDPSGPAEEVINCRCTVLFHYPGDPAYPAEAEQMVGIGDPNQITPATFYDGTMDPAVALSTYFRRNYPEALEVADRGVLQSNVSLLEDAADPAYRAALPPDILELVPTGEARQMAGWYGYTGGRYRSMNRALRGELDDHLGADELNRAFNDYYDANTTTFQQDTVIYRGANDHIGIDGSEWSPGDLRPGQYMTEQGWLSSSLDEPQAGGFGTWLMKIRVAKGRGFTYGTSYEKEVIMKPGQVLRVVSKDDKSKTLLMELVTP